MHELEDRPRRAAVVGVQLPHVSDTEHQASLAELTRLATTLGIPVSERFSQKRAHLDRGAYVGTGTTVREDVPVFAATE